MQISSLKKAAIVAGVVVLAIALWRWALPVALPFGLGTLVALAAEPSVRLLARKLPRGVAAGIGVTATLLGVLALLILLTALLFRQLGALTDQVPKLIQSANRGLESLHNTLSDLSGKAPKGLRPLLLRTVDNAFSGSGAVVESVLQRLPAAASAVLGYLTDSALTVGTGCLAAYMISSRLPQLRTQLLSPQPESTWGKLLPRLKRLRHALWGWLKAQLSLCGMSFLILLVGLLLLGIPYAPLWALLIALVDAVPLLGTGTVLIPWALICFLQGEGLRTVGLLVIYAIALLTRSALEPRLVGRQLGIDPLLTLVSLYAGYQFWGFGGMLVSPLLCVVIKEAATRD